MAVVVSLLSLIRITTLSAERIALNRLGQSGYGALATMGVGFGGAAVVLWAMAGWQGGGVWDESTLWNGLLYAVAFGFYTLSLARGPVSLVSPWSNATVLMLWCLRPSFGSVEIIGFGVFAVGAVLLVSRRITLPVLWMLIGDALLALARIVDVHHVNHAPIAYATSLFTVISLWMFVPIVLRGRLGSLVTMMRKEPGWSFVAASSNAGAYLALFCLLRWLHPAAVEAISAVASSVATCLGVFVLHESDGARKLLASGLMTGGTVLLLFGQASP